MSQETDNPSYSGPDSCNSGIHGRLLVVVPCFQDEKIEGCLDSVRRHTNSTQTSILVIDDCSSAIYSNFLNDLSTSGRFTLVRNCENRGPAFCRNVGILYAIKNGFDYITFVDSDDQLIADLADIDYKSNHITFFNSIELAEAAYKKIHSELLAGPECTLNDCDYGDIPQALAAYLLKPNRVPTFTTCWAKVFSVKLIANAESPLLFDERMRTFEDVDFVIRFCLHARSVSFNRLCTYAHTRYPLGKGATFGTDFNSLFSFLKVARSVRHLITNMQLTSTVSIHHFVAAYYSISIIRCAIKVDGLRSFIKFSQFIRRRVRSPFVQTVFANYSPAKAGGKELFKSLIRLRLSLILSICAVFWAYRRYKSSSF